MFTRIFGARKRRGTVVAETPWALPVHFPVSLNLDQRRAHRLAVFERRQTVIAALGNQAESLILAIVVGNHFVSPLFVKHSVTAVDHVAYRAFLFSHALILHRQMSAYAHRKTPREICARMTMDSFHVVGCCRRGSA